MSRSPRACQIGASRGRSSASPPPPPRPPMAPRWKIQPLPALRQTAFDSRRLRYIPRHFLLPFRGPCPDRVLKGPSSRVSVVATEVVDLDEIAFIDAEVDRSGRPLVLGGVRGGERLRIEFDRTTGESAARSLDRF